MKSWKTTLGGIVGAIGVYVLGLDWELANIVGGVLEGVAFLLVGSTARDNNVTSEEAGA